MVLSEELLIFLDMVMLMQDDMLMQETVLLCRKCRLI